MGYLETGTFCSLDEYLAGIEKRVPETSLPEHEIFTLAIRLKSAKREAAKMAVMTRGVVRESGVVAVHFTFLNARLEPVRDAHGVWSDGLATSLTGATIQDTQTKEYFTMQQAYLRDYFEDQFGGMLAEAEARSLVGAGSASHS